jgi:hypothetical protein
MQHGAIGDCSICLKGVPQNTHLINERSSRVVVVLVAVNDNGITLPSVAPCAIQVHVALYVSVLPIQWIVKRHDVANRWCKSWVARHCLLTAQQTTPVVSLLNPLFCNALLIWQAFLFTSRNVISALAAGFLAPPLVYSARLRAALWRAEPVFAVPEQLPAPHALSLLICSALTITNATSHAKLATKSALKRCDDLHNSLQAIFSRCL